MFTFSFESGIEQMNVKELTSLPFIIFVSNSRTLVLFEFIIFVTTDALVPVGTSSSEYIILNVDFLTYQ